MIKRLDLSDFGKFGKHSLEFAPFTVVLGANETGKTTVFDALFDALCAGSRRENLVPWKRLAERYGALRKAVLTWKGEPMDFGYQEFLEIFAIRAGEAGVNAADGRSWQTAAENRLLNAGLNPAGIAAALIDKAESSRKGTAQARLKELRRLIKAREPELAELKARRDAIFTGEADTARLEADLLGKTAALEARQAELKGLNARIDELAATGRLQTALEGIKALREHKDLTAALAALAAFEKNEIPSYRALAAERAERERGAASCEAALAERRGASDSARAYVAQLVAREPVVKRQVETAAALLAKLNAFAAAPPKLVLTVNKPMRYGIWGGGAALALFVAVSGHSLPAYLAAAAIAGAGAWVGLKLSLKQSLVGPTPEETKALLDGLAVEWAMASEDPLPGDLDGARAVFAKPAADHAALVEAYNAKAAEVADLDAGVAAAAQTLAEYRNAAQASAAAAEAWLNERGCADEDAYQAKFAERERLAAHERDLAERLKVFRLHFDCGSDEELKNKLFTEKEDLQDRRGLDAGKADAQALEALKQETAAAGVEVRNMEMEAASVKAALEKARAVAGAKLESLPGGINRAETDIATAREEIAAVELQVQACLLAAETFNKLAEKSTVAFETLAKETAAMLATVFPGTEAAFASFDAGEASMRDAGGKMREVRHLSSGTRDLFLLGARLLMARKARTAEDGTLSPGLIVLDDPFYTLDPQREQAALKLLTAFHKDTGWQMIIFTKDEAFAQAALSAGMSVKLTELK